MFKFKIWVDADSFPAMARDFTVSFAKSHGISVVFVANHEIKSKIACTGLEMRVVEKKAGAADDFIFDASAENDIVLTRDLPFAARLVEKKISVMNDRGVKFTERNIKERLVEREFSLNLSQIGFGGNKGNYYGEKELRKFSSEFEREVLAHEMAETYNIKKYFV